MCWRVLVVAGVGESEAGGGTSGGARGLDQHWRPSLTEYAALGAWRRADRQESAFVRVKLDGVRCVGAALSRVYKSPCNPCESLFESFVQ